MSIKPGIPIDDSVNRRIESSIVRQKSLRPSVLRERQKRRRRLIKMSSALNALSKPPGSSPHPTSLDLSSWLPYWKISIDGVEFSGEWTSRSKLQIRSSDNKIQVPATYAVGCKFKVANKGISNEVTGQATFKIMNEDKLAEFVPLLRLNNPAKVEMGWTTTLNSKISPDGWDPKSAYSDAMTFRSNLQVTNNQIDYDPNDGTWSVMVDFMGYSDYLLASLHMNDLTIDEGFQGWAASNIFLSEENNVENSNYLVTAQSTDDDAKASDVKITAEGVVETLNQLLNVLNTSNESATAIGSRKKLYKSGDPDGAAPFNTTLEFVCDERIINDTMSLANFKPHIQDEKKRKLRLASAVAGIGDAFTKDNKIDSAQSSLTDKTGKSYYFLTEYVDDPNDDSNEPIKQLKFTSIGGEGDEQNPADISPLQIARNFTWLKSLNVSQEKDKVITAKAFADESKIEGKDTEVASDKENSAQEGGAERASDPKKEIFLYPFKASITLEGLAGWRLFQKVNLQGLGGSDFYDGLYIIGDIEYSANNSGWDVSLDLTPDVSSGSFPNVNAILARHLPPTQLSKASTEPGAAAKYENSLEPLGNAP